MKNFSLIVLMLLLTTSAVFAQRTITGTVTDESGEALISVNVVVKGSTTGTITDIDGKYSISVPEGSTALLFSYTGFNTEEVTLEASNVVDVVMTEGVLLNDVVVTALGLKADPDKQGTSSSQVGGQKIVNSGETGVIQGLSGKASGVAITRNTGDPGAGAYIQIRGQSTITGDLQPLIVVDGMPIYNSSINTEANTGGVVEQSRLNDINPDDIESVQVLKGAAAAAQWGTRAANGVIIITTKRGKMNNKSFSVNFRSTVSVDQVNITHDLQNVYGQGFGGSWGPNSALTWGDRISSRAGGADLVDDTGQYFETTDGTIYYPILEKRSQETYLQENLDQVFRNGFFADNSLSISGGDENGSFFASFANLNQQGIMRGNSDYNRTNFRINADRRLGDKLKLSVNSAYIKTTSNRVQQGSNLNGLYLGMLRTSPDFNNTGHTGAHVSASGVRTERAHRAYRDYLGNRIVGGLPIGPVYNNPGWTIYEQENTSEVDRIVVGTELSYDPTNWLNITGRVGVDNYTDDRFTLYPVGSAAGLVGLAKNTIQETQTNADVFARATKSFGRNFSINGLVGFNFNERRYDRLGGSINSFILPYAPANLDNATPASSTTSDFSSTVRTAAAYFTASADLYDQLFLTVTGRQEAASTFGAEAQSSFFYPSASAAWQFTKLGALANNSVLNFGKLRLGYGVVGIQPPVYASSTLYTSSSLVSGWGPTLNAGDYGQGSYTPSNRLGNVNLRPERKTEFEIGTDLRFFGDRTSVSFTYYQNVTTDAIFAVDVPISTGFYDKLDNAATIENKGYELDINTLVYKQGDFSFDLGLNWFRNVNVVTDLNGVESIFLNGFTGSSSRAVEGHPMGALWAGSFQRDDNGNYILNDAGFPIVAPSEGVVGDPNPDWRGGLSATARWKGLGFNILFETSQGNDMWFGTEGVLRYFGTSAATAHDLVTFTPAEAAATVLSNGATVADYYAANADGNYTVRGTYQDFGDGDVFLDQSWYLANGGGFGPVGEQFVKDASWTRIREMALSYRLDSKKFRDATKLGSIDFSLTGRNLVIWTEAEGIDPDTNLTGASNGRGLDYFTNPGTRSYLFTIKVTY
jgi:TonB-linked SusC/RagA family outer membrane protein